MVTDISNLNHWAEKLGLDKINEDIYQKTKVNLIDKIYDLANNPKLSSVFENEVKSLLVENYPGLSEFLLRTKKAKNSKDAAGIKAAKKAFGAPNILKVRQFIGFANRVHHHYCDNEEDSCVYCSEHQLPSLEYYEGQSLQESLDNQCLSEDFSGDLELELASLKVFKGESLQKRARRDNEKITK